MRVACVIAAVALIAHSTLARADGEDVPSVTTPVPAPDLGVPPPEPPEAQPVRVKAFRVRGHSKLHARTLSYLSHVDVGDYVTPGDEPAIEEALMSSELFKTATVAFVPVDDDDVIVECTLDDKMSWIAAPTAYVLPSHWSVGAGYAESDLDGTNRKLLLYGQLGNRTSLFLATYLDPSIHGTKWQTRFDIYTLHQVEDEYLNPQDDPRSQAIGRETTYDFLDAGALLGYAFRWWLVVDARVRGAYVDYRHTHDAYGNPMPAPDIDGRDFAFQQRVTMDHRFHYRGVTWGPYLQVIVEEALPKISTYQYQDTTVRAYYSWRLFGMHELELRSNFNIGRHEPFNQEQTVGGVADLRGYEVDQFRGDTRAMFRAEYSVPVINWRMFYWRAIGFFDSAYDGFHFQDPSGMRDYLPTQALGDSWFRTDVGAGVRLYVSSIVLPLLGFDIAYGIEAHALEYYFELGLTDF